MTLELGLLTEHKVSKLIELHEELRRDLPNVEDRADEEAKAMAQKPDHSAVITVIDETANQAGGDDNA